MFAYHNSIGKHEKAIVRQALQANEPIPDKILNAPQLILGLEFFYLAFSDLDSTRTLGDNLQSISWLSINEYAKYNNLDDEQSDRLHKYIRAIDNDHIKRIENERKSKMKTKK